MTQANEHPLYPISLIGLAEAKVIVIGGGPVGERKARGVLAAGAQVVLIAPTATDAIQQWAREGTLVWHERGYATGDCEGAFLVFAATNQRLVNQQVTEDARQQKIWCNVADAPDEGNFYLPAVHRQDDLVIAVNTTGKRPRRAKRIRDFLRDCLKSEGR